MLNIELKADEIGFLTNFIKKGKKDATWIRQVEV
jgi:hypothetical protein